MNVLGRLWRAIIDDYPDVPNTADTDEGNSSEEEPGIQCRWIEISVRCRSPLNEGEGLPGGCDARCPARLQNEHLAQMRTREDDMTGHFKQGAWVEDPPVPEPEPIPEPTELIEEIHVHICVHVDENDIRPSWWQRVRAMLDEWS